MWPFSHKLKGKFTIKLAELKFKSTIEDNYKMEIESKRMVPQYFVSIKIREPCVEKEYKNVSKPVLSITKTYPPFDIDGTGNSSNTHDVIDNTSNNYNNTNIVNNDNSNKKLTNLVTDKKEVEISKPKPNNNTNVNNNNNTSTTVKPTEKKIIDKSQFTNEELEDPDNLEMLNTIKVLELGLAKVEKEIQAVEGRIPPKLRQRKLGLSVKKNQITQATQNGDITLKNYLDIAKLQLKKDFNLMLYFEQIGDKNKKSIVEERVNVLKKEILEGEAYLKTSG